MSEFEQGQEVGEQNESAPEIEKAGEDFISETERRIRQLTLSRNVGIAGVAAGLAGGVFSGLSHEYAITAFFAAGTIQQAVSAIGAQLEISSSRNREINGENNE